jgi:hypothetical protein
MTQAYGWPRYRCEGGSGVAALSSVTPASVSWSRSEIGRYLDYCRQRAQAGTQLQNRRRERRFWGASGPRGADHPAGG